MQFSHLLAAMPLLAAVCSAIPHSKRVTESDVQLYAYGTNISALPLWYGNSDGLVYIGASPGTGYSNLTWTIDTTGTLPWNATIVSNATTVGTFYIVDDGSSYDAVGFITSSNTTIANTITTGFKLFGGQVIVDVDSTYESQFWGEETSTDGVWSLKWNSNGASQTGSTPIVIKNQGLPTSA